MRSCRVSIVDYHKVPILSRDDVLLYRALSQLGLSVDVCSWHDNSVDWLSYGAVIVRSTWDYHDYINKYIEWLGFLNYVDSPLVNSADLILKNLNKRYLLEFMSAGIDVIPTVLLNRGDKLIDDFDMLSDYREELVVKPAIGASAKGVTKYNKEDFFNSFKNIQSELNQSDLIFQPYIDEIKFSGEWSLIFFDGKYSHSVLKQPSENDFRVQGKFGGRYFSADPDPKIIVYIIENIIPMLESCPFYLRVDGIVLGDIFLLMEVELNEPCLFFGSNPDSAVDFSRKIFHKAARSEGLTYGYQ